MGPKLFCMSQWSEELVSRFADAMRRRRMELKLSAQDVADRTAALGHPINRSAIAAWENHGRGDRLMLGDALALAEALRMPIGAMLYPNLPDGEVEAYPGVNTLSYVAALSLAGSVYPLTGSDVVPEGEDDALVGERAGELLSGYELTQATRALTEQRMTCEELQHNLDEALRRGDAASAETTMKMLTGARKLLEMHANAVRRLGGVVVQDG